MKQRHRNETVWLIVFFAIFFISQNAICRADDWWDDGQEESLDTPQTADVAGRNAPAKQPEQTKQPAVAATQEPKRETAPTDVITTARDAQGRVTGASRINWEQGYIEVMAGATADPKQAVSQAHAYSIALKTARHLAYEKLAETVRGLRVTSNTTYDHELHQDSRLKTALDAVVRGARVIWEEGNEFRDGSMWVEVTLGLDMYGEHSAITPCLDRQLPPRKSGDPQEQNQLNVQKKENKKTATVSASIPATVTSMETKTSTVQTSRARGKQGKTCSAAITTWSKPHRSTPGQQGNRSNRQVGTGPGLHIQNGSLPLVRALKPGEPFTGLVVVATGLDARPAMLPRIVAENGDVLYSGRIASPRYIRQVGLMGYQSSLPKALQLDRIGENPLVVRARSVAGQYHADYVLSDGDADLVRRAAGKNDFLKQCRVAAVLGR